MDILLYYLPFGIYFIFTYFKRILYKIGSFIYYSHTIYLYKKYVILDSTFNEYTVYITYLTYGVFLVS